MRSVSMCVEMPPWVFCHGHKVGPAQGWQTPFTSSFASHAINHCHDRMTVILSSAVVGYMEAVDGMIGEVGSDSIPTAAVSYALAG